MTNEQAKSELMQIYGSLSETKKQALDVLMAQAKLQAHVIQSALDNDTNTVIATGGTQADEVCDNDCEHCAWTECPKDDAQADGDLISRQSVIDAFYDMPNYTFSTLDVLTVLKQLPSVAIPTEHDGCHNCRWQSQSESEMPCKQCMRNYTDEWEREKPNELLDKIKEEILDLGGYREYRGLVPNEKLEQALAIIDKYRKGEQE